jgi:hypothetical protein
MIEPKQKNNIGYKKKVRFVNSKDICVSDENDHRFYIPFEPTKKLILRLFDGREFVYKLVKKRINK